MIWMTPYYLEPNIDDSFRLGEYNFIQDTDTIRAKKTARWGAVRFVRIFLFMNKNFATPLRGIGYFFAKKVGDIREKIE